MKAAVIKEPGGVPSYESFAEPPADAHRQLVTLVATGIHPVVRALASGRHYGSEGDWPQIPGVDAVARTEDGRLVYTGSTRPPYGTFAERMSVPMTLPLPEGADPVQVAGGMNPALSSWLPLRSRQADGALGTVLVLGATGVAGGLAVQNAFALGAEAVLAVGRNRAALERLDSPATITLALSGDDDRDSDAMKALLADRRPRTVLDFVWGRPAELTFAALSRSGMVDDTNGCVYVEIGASAGAVAQLPAALLRSTAITIRGAGAGASETDQIMTELPIVMSKIADGTVEVPVSPYPIADVDQAWRTDHPGKRVVLIA